MNQTLNSDECLQVFVRCRPLLESEMMLPVPVEVHPEVNKIIVRDVGCKTAVKAFSFDKVFGPEARQASVYNNVAAPLIQEVLMGFNCTILAYGQTGTGKTFTIEGDRNAALNTAEQSKAGIIPRSMSHIFEELAKQECNFEVGVSFLELYNEEIYDLLSKAEDLTKLKLYDSAKGSVTVQGLEIRNVRSMTDVFEVLDKGCKKRRKAATLLNKMSSRSHTLFTVNVRMKEHSTTVEKIKIGKLNLVDLAGSENIGRSGAMDKRAREAGNINQSLLALGRVITALCENALHIPYRESKLTRLLRDSLGGQTKTSVIATISPSVVHLDETLNTLEYALRAKNILNKPEINAQVSATALTRDYLGKILSLETQLDQELSSKEKFQVDPDNVKYLDAAIATIARESSEEFEIEEKMMAESEELDVLILKAQETLRLQKLELSKIKREQDEIDERIAKEQEEIRLEERELLILDPVMAKFHEKLHKSMKEKEEITNEVNKMEKITSEAVNRNSRLQTQFSSMCRAQAKFNDILLEFKNQLMNRVDAVQKTMMGETAECERHLSSLNSGYGSFIENSEKLCQQFGNVLNDVEKLEGNFQDALTNALRDEETQAQERQSDIKSNISCLISCNFDPLQPLLNDCGENLRNIFVYLTHWRDTLLEKLTIQEELLNDYLSTEDKNLGLLRDSCKDVTQKQKEFIQEYSELISSALSEKHERKTIFDEKINAIEEAVEEIKNFLLEKLDDDVDKSIMVFDKFRKHADGEMRNAESLLAFSESSIRSTEDFTGEMAVSSIEALDHKMQEMRESANNAMANYQNLLTNFENCVDETKASIEPMKALEKRVADDNSRRIEIPSITSNIQNFKENLTIKNKSCETLSRDHEAELKIIETNQVTAMKEAQDSFNQLHGTFKEAVSRNISCIETSDMNGFSWRENIMKDDYEEEDDCNKTLLSTEHSNPERNVLDVTFTLSEENNKEKDTGCKFCIDKDETMATQSPPIIVAKSSKFSVSKGSKQRKNTKEISHFDKVEKWFQELVGNDLDDTSSEGEKSDTTA